MLACGMLMAGSKWIDYDAMTMGMDNGLNDGIRVTRKPFIGPVNFSSSSSSFFDAFALLVSRVIKYTSICREWSNYINLNHRQIHC